MPMLFRLLRRTSPLVLAPMFCALPALAASLPPNVFADPEVDIDESWQGMAVSGKFGIQDAWHSYAGAIDGYQSQITCPPGICSDGGFSASVVGEGHGEVKAKARMLHRGPGGNNLGTSSQSLKPFTVAGTGPVASSITLSFDGLMVVDEGRSGASDWSQARVEYMAAITRFNPATNEHEVYGRNVFEGMATVTQRGNRQVEIGVPESYSDDLDENIRNGWHGNPNLSVRKVVAGTAGAGEISVGSLTGNTRTEALAHLAAGREVQFLVYTETFNFTAEGGETYYVTMDLLTAVNASNSSGGFEETFALADFSNTIVYQLDGGDGVTTHLLFDGGVPGADSVDVAASSPFGGANSVLTLRDAATMNVGAPDLTLAESVVMDDGVIDTNGNAVTLGGTLAGNGTIRGGGTLRATGAVRPGNSIGTLTVDGARYTQGTGSALEIEIDDAGATDRVAAANGGSIVIETGATLVAQPLEPITASRSYTFMTAPAAIQGTFDDVLGDSGMLTFSIEKGDSDREYVLNVTRTPFAAVAPASALGAALDAVEAAGGAGPLQTLLSDIVAMSRDDAAAALEKLQPDSSGAAAAATGMTTAAMQTVVGARTASLRGGRAGGDMIADGAIWAQGLYGEARQRDRGGNAGYRANHHGLAVGIDGEVLDAARVGLAYSYGEADADGRLSDTESRGHTVMLYGSYERAGWYADGMLSYGWHDYDGTRDTGIGIAEGDYHGTQFAARADVGRPLAWGQAVVTPTGTLRYGRLSLDGYQETGAPGANLAMASQTFDTVTAGVGGKVAAEYALGAGWSVQPEARLGVTYDVLRDDVGPTARFVAGGPAFATGGLTPARTAFEAGAGLTFAGPAGTELMLSYDGEFRDGYDGHAGMARLRQSF